MSRSPEQLKARSEVALKGVHPDLQEVYWNTPCVAGYQMCVTEGLRSAERQAQLLKEGASRTSNSRHFGPIGHAFDFAMFKGGAFVKEVDPAYREQWHAFKKTGKRLGVDVAWGGDWPSINDGTHVQLSWAAYPLTKNPKTSANSKTIAASVFGFPVAAYVPELFGAIESLVGKLSFFDDDVIKYAQFGLVALIAAFVVNERIQKMKREGV